MNSDLPPSPDDDVVRPMTERRQRGDSLDIVAEPMLRQLAGYWLSRRHGQAMPRRADIDPLDIPWALSRLFLLDCVPEIGANGGPWRYRYRLAGEDIEAVFRKYMKRSSARNTWLDDMMPPDTLVAVMNRWQPLPDFGQIIYMQGMIYRLAHRFAHGGRLMLPLADEPGGPVTGLIGATECDWIDRKPEAEGMDITITYIPAAGLP